MNLFKTLAILLIIGILTGTNLSCRKVNEQINSNLLVSVEQDGTEYRLILETVSEFPCSNYSITFEEFDVKNGFGYSMLDIDKPSVCLTAIGPAKTILSLGSLDQGIYKIRILHNNKTHKGKLTITSQPVLSGFNKKDVSIK